MNNIKSRIEYSIANCGMNGLDAKKLKVCDATITNIVKRTFWNPQKSKFFSLTDSDVLNIYSEKDAFKYLCEVNGQIYDKAYFSEVADKSGLKSSDIRKIIYGCIESHLIDHLKVYGQRSSIEMRVDMFADKPRIEMRDELARVIFTHHSFIASTQIRSDVVADYKEHFPMLDDFLDFIVASRFARDRKKSYLWFKCTSDWGKGFLMGLLAKLDISTELSVKEVEGMFEGKPVGKSMMDFKRCFALIFDEFKTVKSELKQLQSEITLAPKNQLSFKVEVFAKLFFSAESVNSLVGEHGVEDQFINRFSHFDLTGEITKRELFRKIGAGAYLDALQPYIVDYLNSAIRKKVSVGQKNAELEAEQYLNSFMGKYGLGNTYSRLSDGLEDIVVDIAMQLNRQCNASGEFDIVRNDSGLFLKRPAKYIEQYINETFAYSDKATISKKRNDIITLLSVDGKGVYPHWITKDKQDKAILINPDFLKNRGN